MYRNLAQALILEAFGPDNDRVPHGGGLREASIDVPAGANETSPLPNLGASNLGETDESGNLWIEIDFSKAPSPRSPRWRYSSSAGWAPPDWGFNTNPDGAEAWDRLNNMSMMSDPIGRVLEIGPSSQLQLMFGLVSLQSYGGAAVLLEGRSRATSSEAYFDVYNPATGCGASEALNPNWTPEVVRVDLSGCFQAGSNLQAVRVHPTSGTIALRRLRLTLRGATW